MKLILAPLFTSLLFHFSASPTLEDEPLISKETEECLACHIELHPGLVKSWEISKHSQISPKLALANEKLSRKISTEIIPENLQNIVVGCYECHSINTDKHGDSFEHNGYTINVIVSPNDCAVCHENEVNEYSENLMSHAYSNLMDNEVYMDLKKTITGHYYLNNDGLSITDNNPVTDRDACLYCHGTRITVDGTYIKETDFGDLTFPKLIGWPNQGVGRINPDGSRGSCTSCHPRHDFSIETARKPYTCAECHKGPDVPAYKVYEVSKHGNIYNSIGDKFDFSAVPWEIGEDFTVPTCASCHISLIVDHNNKVIADRTHKLNDRLAWRIFGVPYAHPHSISADLSNIKNSIGLPLSTELNSDPVEEFLIDKSEMALRNENMQRICKSCHSISWVENHFSQLENTIIETNATTVTGTEILSQAWKNGYAHGIPQKANIFDESIERDWTSIWLFYANSTRFSSAMAGGGDYGVFANGRYQMSEMLIKMQEWMKLHDQLNKRWKREHNNK
jgi:hypothetical protein